MNILKSIAIFFVLFFLFSKCKNQAKQEQTSTTKKSYQINDTVEDFSLLNIDGNMVALANYPNAKGFIVVFTCNHCPCAKSYENRIIALDSIYKPKGFPVIAINSNDTINSTDEKFEYMIERAKNSGFTYPYLVDANQAVAKQFGATKTPHVFVLHKVNDKLVLKYIGAVDDNLDNETQVTQRYVATAVEALLDNRPIHIKKTNAVGCGIFVTGEQH